jgi:hypothetical protein
MTCCIQPNHREFVKEKQDCAPEGVADKMTVVDTLLVCFFIFCLWGNISVDIWMGFDVDLSDTGFEFHKIVYQQGAQYDPLFVHNSPYMRWSALLTAIFYAPYYIFATRSLLNGDGLGKKNSLTRNYSWFYSIGMFLNMSVVLLLEFREYYANSKLAPRMGLYWIPCGAYWCIPFLLIFRMYKEDYHADIKVD